MQQSPSPVSEFKTPFPVPRAKALSSPTSNSNDSVSLVGGGASIISNGHGNSNSGSGPRTTHKPPDPDTAENGTEDSSFNEERKAAPSPKGLGLPEGFFDDPKLDAKARGLEWRDPEEVEWENFVKEMAGEDLKSSSMRVEDEEESTKVRELEEIEEQMAHWQK